MYAGRRAWAHGRDLYGVFLQESTVAGDLLAAAREKLLAKAIPIIDLVSRNGGILEGITFGGGTGLMLQIGHRDSRDIDAFLPDPQLPGYTANSVEDVT